MEDTLALLTEPEARMQCHACQSVLDVSLMPPMSLFDCPVCSQELHAQCRLEAFRLLHPLGEGGMAIVFEALDIMLERHVAIKIMRHEISHESKFIDQFIREARSAARIQSQNIVQILSVGEKNHRIYLVMELVRGGKLDRLVKEGRPLEEVRVLSIALDVARGLQAAQEINIIHGDVKPENILFDNHGVAKISDFGLARFASKKRKLKPDEVWGTPNYIAPEKARDHTEDFRSDIYSLGATLFYAFTGRPPFTGNSPVDVVRARLTDPTPDVRDFRPDLFKSTADVVARMLEAKPSLRYPNYRSLIGDLETVLDHVRKEGALRSPRTRITRIQRPKTEVPQAMPASAKKPVSQLAIWIGSGLTVLILFLLLATGSGTSPKRKPAPLPSPKETVTFSSPSTGCDYHPRLEPHPGCILYWNFEDPDGVRIYDVNGMGNHGRSYNMDAAARTNGFHGRAICFDGVDDCLRAAVTLLKGDLTVCCWFKIEEPIAPSSDMRLFDLAREDRFGLQLCLSSEKERTGCLKVPDEGGPAQTILTKERCDDGAWHHAAIVRKGKTYSLYLDGTSAGEAPGDLTVYAKLVVGTRTRSSQGYYFKGCLDDMRIYKRALSATELSQQIPAEEDNHQ